jgi:hypothetical protein
VNLKLNPNKCYFAAKSITFLGHVVSKEGTRLDPGKIETVLHFPTPRTVTSVRSFLGLTGYYRKYIRGYSRLVGPLFELTRKDVAFVWDVGYQHAYQALKVALVDAPVLTCRNPTLAKCEGEAQHSQSWGLGVLRDSRMFRVRQQGPKHLALGCSWCH